MGKGFEIKKQKFFFWFRFVVGIIFLIPTGAIFISVLLGQGIYITYWLVGFLLEALAEFMFPKAYLGWYGVYTPVLAFWLFFTPRDFLVLNCTVSGIGAVMFLRALYAIRIWYKKRVDSEANSPWF